MPENDIEADYVDIQGTPTLQENNYFSQSMVSSLVMNDSKKNVIVASFENPDESDETHPMAMILEVMNSVNSN